MYTPLSRSTGTWQQCPGVSSSLPETHAWQRYLKESDHATIKLKAQSWKQSAEKRTFYWAKISRQHKLSHLERFLYRLWWSAKALLRRSRPAVYCNNAESLPHQNGPKPRSGVLSGNDVFRLDHHLTGTENSNALLLQYITRSRNFSHEGYNLLSILQCFQKQGSASQNINRVNCLNVTLCSKLHQLSQTIRLR